MIEASFLDRNSSKTFRTQFCHAKKKKKKKKKTQESRCCTRSRPLQNFPHTILGRVKRKKTTAQESRWLGRFHSTCARLYSGLYPAPCEEGFVFLWAFHELGSGFGRQLLFLRQNFPLAFLPQEVSEPPASSQKGPV